MKKIFTILILFANQSFSQIVFQEDFESGVPGSMVETPVAGSISWSANSGTTGTSYYPYAGSTSATLSGGGNVYLESPVFDGSIGDLFLSFYFSRQSSNGWNVLVSKDAGSTWTNIVNRGQSINSWDFVNYKIPAHLTSSTMKIRFQVSSQSTSSFAGLDNILVQSKPCGTVPLVSVFPYTENFDTTANNTLPCGWKTEDSTNRVYLSEYCRSSQINELFLNENASKGVFTNDFQFVYGKVYKLELIYAAGHDFPTHLEVKYGQGQHDSLMTNSLFTDSVISSCFSINNYSKANMVFTPPSTGVYNLGFKCYGNVNVAVDSLKISEVTTTGIEEENVENFIIYPNPNNGSFEIKNISFNNLADIRILNLQGKQIFNSTMNFSNQKNHKIDLSGFPKGIYLLNIQSEKLTYTKKVIIK